MTTDKLLLTSLHYWTSPGGDNWFLQAFSELCTIPHEQLLARLDSFRSVEENIGLVLAGNDVLLSRSSGGADVLHPVASLLVETVNVVNELLAIVYLERVENEIKRRNLVILVIFTHLYCFYYCTLCC